MKKLLKNNIVLFFLITDLTLIAIVLFNCIVPIRYNNDCNDKNLFRYRLGIYKIDTTMANKVNSKKIGGFGNFLGFTKLECLDTLESQKLDKIKQSQDSLNTSQQWRSLNNGLWINKNGDIGLKDFRSLGEGSVPVEYYITKFGFNEEGDLKNTIDTATFQDLGNTYYKDKNHIYHFYAMAGGGSFYIFEEADYETFQTMGDCYAKDKNHIYESRAGIIKNADYKTFVSKKGTGGCIAKDKNGYFNWDRRIDPKEMQNEDLQKLIKAFDSAKL